MSLSSKHRAFLEQLISTPSPTGYEKPGQECWLDYVTSCSDRQITDAYGSAAAYLEVPGAHRTLMLEAHADEIGMVVQYIDDTGFVYVSKIGGSDPSIARARHVDIHTRHGLVKGIIGNTAIHLQSKDQPQKTPLWREVYIDIGAKTKMDALNQIQIGDPITYSDQLQWLSEELLVGRALDNRIGGFIIARVLERLHDLKDALRVNVVALNAVQEEIGGFGAKMMSHRIQPDWAIVTDVTHATDTPGIQQKEHGAIGLGQGPTITHGTSCHPNLVSYIVDIAKQHDVPLQHEASSLRTGTDTDSIYHVRDGIPSILLSLPLRYMHSPVEMASIYDVENLIDLMAYTVLALTGEEHFNVFSQRS